MIWLNRLVVMIQRWYRLLKGDPGWLYHRLYPADPEVHHRLVYTVEPQADGTSVLQFWHFNQAVKCGDTLDVQRSIPIWFIDGEELESFGLEVPEGAVVRRKIVTIPGLTSDAQIQRAVHVVSTIMVRSESFQNPHRLFRAEDTGNGILTLRHEQPTEVVLSLEQATFVARLDKALAELQAAETYGKLEITRADMVAIRDLPQLVVDEVFDRAILFGIRCTCGCRSAVTAAVSLTSVRMDFHYLNRVYGWVACRKHRWMFNLQTNIALPMGRRWPYPPNSNTQLKRVGEPAEVAVTVVQNIAALITHPNHKADVKSAR